jgi:1-phosphatidylinositol-3-phosphate 5-kinase
MEPQSDPDSDSTINAKASSMPSPPSMTPPVTAPSQEDRSSPSTSIPIAHPATAKELVEPNSEVSMIASETPRPVEHSPVVQPSRLPRRNAAQDSKVAALVKQFQPLPKAVPGSPNYSRSPPVVLVSESEAEPEREPLRRSRSKGRPATIYPALGDSITSDFERSYAANVAPRHFAYTRHGHASRIPAPILSGSEAQSRTNSPVRPLHTGGRTVRFGAGGFRSFSPPRPDKSASPNPKKGKGKARDKPPSSIRLPPSSKALGKRPANALGHNRVGNIARQFERIARESERTRRAAMRGRRARPVATARVTVEVLNTVRDGFRDHASESRSSSSEADDEDEGEDGGGASGEPTSLIEAPPSDAREHQESPEPAPTKESSPSAEPDIETLLRQESRNNTLTSSQEIEQVDSSAPPSPFPGTFGTMADRDINGSEKDKMTLLKAFNLFKDWSQPQTDRGPEVVYPGYVLLVIWCLIVLISLVSTKSEHFFRESTIIVREDEPTSFIAFALECVPRHTGLSD